MFTRIPKKRFMTSAFIAGCIFSFMAYILVFHSKFNQLAHSRIAEISRQFDLFAFTSRSENWLSIYSDYFIRYFKYAYENPLIAMVGEGVAGYRDNIFPRGGDVAVTEILATFGIPMSIYFFAIIVYAIKMGWTALNAVNISYPRAEHLLFGVTVAAFLLLTLAHYNTLFNKAVFIFLYLALGLIRRYAFIDLRAEPPRHST